MPWVVRKTFLCTGRAHRNTCIDCNRQSNLNNPLDTLAPDTVEIDSQRRCALSVFHPDIFANPLDTDIPVFLDANGSILVLFGRPNTPNTGLSMPHNKLGIRLHHTDVSSNRWRLCLVGTFDCNRGAALHKLLLGTTCPWNQYPS